MHRSGLPPAACRPRIWRVGARQCGRWSGLPRLCAPALLSAPTSAGTGSCATTVPSDTGAVAGGGDLSGKSGQQRGRDATACACGILAAPRGSFPHPVTARPSGCECVRTGSVGGLIPVGGAHGAATYGGGSPAQGLAWSNPGGQTPRWPSGAGGDPRPAAAICSMTEVFLHQLAAGGLHPAGCRKRLNTSISGPLHRVDQQIPRRASRPGAMPTLLAEGVIRRHHQFEIEGEQGSKWRSRGPARPR